MTLQQIYYALIIAEEGSMNRAAGRLFVSQPALTGTIQSLESEIDITIFSRSKRGVSLTAEGEEFLKYARQLYQQYEVLEDKYGAEGSRRKKFAVSAQHYTFAVRAFTDTVRHFGTLQFEFAMRETKTREVIADVGSGRSEVGILFLSDLNEQVIMRMLRQENLTFSDIAQATAYVYLHESHPLAGRDAVSLKELLPYPCLAFEQDAQSSVFLSEEILSEKEYPRKILVNDRATMLNLIEELKGYTLCSGIIYDEMNGSGFRSVPFLEDAENKNSTMRIGYIVKKNSIRSEMGQYFLEACIRYVGG